MAANKVLACAPPLPGRSGGPNARAQRRERPTLGSKFVDATRMQAIVETFLTTHCTEERHARRVGKIKAIEESYLKEPNSVSDAFLVDRIAGCARPDGRRRGRAALRLPLRSRRLLS